MSIKKLGFLLSYFLMVSCTKIGGFHHSTTPQAASSPYSMPSEAYLAMANNQTGQERQNLLLTAAGRALYDGQLRQTEAILAQTHELSPIQNDQKLILSAKIDSMRDKPRQALAKLAQVHSQQQLPPLYQLQYHEVLARSYEATGNQIHAIFERTKLDPLWLDESSRMNSRRILWLNLTRLPESELNTLSVESKNGSDLQGWMQLALIAKQGNESPLIQRVEEWQQRFPRHPGNSLLPSSLDRVKPALHPAPRQVALLIPLSGTLAGPGNAVKDGFMAAYQASGETSQTSVKIYDTAAADPIDLYQQAINEGANYVVGPLTKAETSKIAPLDHPVPTLLLNDLNDKVGENTYRFGLSPSNEARQVAVKASKKGLKHALVIAPSGAWGDEVSTAFTVQFAETGGQVIERLSYDNSTNLGEAVRAFLHVSEKEAQGKQLRTTANQSEPALPKRREDFDMIFLLAYPSKGRQIMPLLRYYFAGDVPVFATSSVYAGVTNTILDRDLDGILFCDMPSIFSNQQNPNKNWPEQMNSYNRLYAIGQDSYALSKKLNQLLVFPAMGISEKAGVLYLNKAQRIARILAWGRFHGGVAEKVEDMT